MILHTPPENQGQIVEISYGWHEGDLYKRVYDRSDRSTQWYRASSQRQINRYIASGSEPWDEEPSISAWKACDDPEPEETR